jgi:hypothetical protein
MVFLGEIGLYDGIFRKLPLSMAFLGLGWLSMVFHGFSHRKNSISSQVKAELITLESDQGGGGVMPK